jgi:hypothetical protein
VQRVEVVLAIHITSDYPVLLGRGYVVLGNYYLILGESEKLEEEFRWYVCGERSRISNQLLSYG